MALATVNAAAHDATALATLEKGMKTGAINASGNGVPDKATVDGLAAAFTKQPDGASNWSVERAKDHATSADIVTASIVRELPSAAASGRTPGTEAAMYRLVLTCNTGSRTGTMQLAWSPEARRGTLAVALDGSRPSPTQWTARNGWATARPQRPDLRRMCSRGSAAVQMP